MSKMATIAKDNLFYRARISSDNETYKNRVNTAKEIFISNRRLEEIETGKREPYTDEIMIMAEAYDAPYLIEHYCNHICRIGQKFGCKYTVNKSDAYKATVMFVHSLKEAEQAKERILEILSDGEITLDEISMLDASISKLNETMSDIINLKIALEKEKIKGGLK